MSFKPANPEMWQAHFEQYEGRQKHFYLDSTNNVTIGVGCLVTVPTSLPMVRKSTNIRATVTDIMQDFSAVKALPANKVASYYDRVCLLYLPDDAIDALFQARLSAELQQIEDSIVSLADYPDLAALVLTDMCFTDGVHGISRDFPKFMNAFLAKDYTTCALESDRLHIQQSRNDWARASLEGLR